MTKYLFSAVVIIIGLSASAQARSISNYNAKCTTRENATVSASFSGMGETPKAVNAKIDAQLANVQKMATEIGLENLEPNNRSYNIYAQNNRHKVDGYNYNGSMSYTINDSAKAIELMELMIDNDMEASVNVNINRNGNCS
ncbi:MAG: hypothetical protein MK052_09105 [Alphaproteobacteria bacterium]|nr:hypothetical protein [Alphaproteobacteria bacterium]